MSVFWFSFVLIYTIQVLFSAALEIVNLKHLRRGEGEVPGVFEGFIDDSAYRKATAYVGDKAVLNLVHDIGSEAVLLGLLLSGFLAEVDRFLTGSIEGPIPRGLLFWLVPGVLLQVLGLPFSYLHTFGVEEKYGFNRTTRLQWMVDVVKTGGLSLTVFCPVLCLVLWLVQSFQESWWLLAFLLVSLVQALLSILYPCCIAPLFNRFTPIRDEELAGRIRDLMERNDIRVQRILEMDAGTRSRHTNAYFTGIGRTKQIVLFDTLLEMHPPDEILAVLAHEAGHFKGRHVLKQLFISEVGLLLVFCLTALLLQVPPVFTAFGFDPAHGYTALFVVAVFWQKVGFFGLPLFMWLSRRFERDADVFAARLMGTAVPLATAFKRMAAHNLSNLRPHPFYVAFHYSHPPLSERIDLLECTFRGACTKQSLPSQ